MATKIFTTRNAITVVEDPTVVINKMGNLNTYIDVTLINKTIRIWKDHVIAILEVS